MPGLLKPAGGGAMLPQSRKHGGKGPSVAQGGAARDCEKDS
jgi:hypothetical protein